jgi:hypothetical protein
VELVLGERRELDQRSRRLVEECALARHLPYWIRLLGHRDTGVRNRAMVHFEALTGQKIDRPKEQPKASAEEVARLVKDLRQMPKTVIQYKRAWYSTTMVISSHTYTPFLNW